MVVAIDKPQLNWQQAEAVEKLGNLLEDGIRIVGLYGTAGTGKTFAAAALLEQLRGKVLVVASTNTAVKQLKRSLKKSDRTVEVMTIAKALGQQPDYDEEGNMIFVSAILEDDDLLGAKRQGLEDVDFLMIDEASMLARKNLEDILSKIKPSCKVLILMDKYQLPPVGEKEIYAEHLVGSNYYELTKTERYSEDSYIYQVITSARNAVIRRDRTFNLLHAFPKDGEDYYVRDEISAMGGLAKMCHLQMRLEKWELVRCICWSNAAAHKVNEVIREFMFGGWCEGQSYIPGEILIATGAVNRQERGRNVVVYPTSTNVIVQDSKPYTLWDRDEEEYRAWNVIVKDPDDDSPAFKEREVHLIDWRDRSRYLSKLEKLRANLGIVSKESGYKSVPWKKAFGQYKQFEELIDPITHSYAITSHRSQGASINMSFLNVSNIMTNRMDIDVRLRSLFVGASRARKAIMVF